MSSNAWTAGPLKPILGENEVHVWKIFTPTLTDKRKQSLKECLSLDEIQRVNRFYFDADKDRFLIGRGALRVTLAAYLRLRPVDLSFDVDEFGKPFLKDYALYFNISHSKEFVIFAISSSPWIGIDVEYCKEKLNFLSIAKQFCSAHELSQMSELNPLEIRVAFYRCWTRKEAFVKAIGKGLFFPLEKMEVNFLSKNDARIEIISMDEQKYNINDNLLKEHFWKLEEIDLAPEGREYMAALVMPSNYSCSCFWNWQ